MGIAELMGIGAGLQSAGQSIQRRQQEKELKRQQDQAFNNLLSQMQLQYGLEPVPADVALQTLTPELRREYDLGRRTTFTLPSGEVRQMYQPYSRTPEGMEASKRATARQANITALKQAGLSDAEAAALADAPPQAIYSALLERKFPRDTPTYDSARGAVVNPRTGEVQALEGLPDRPSTENPWQYDPNRGALVNTRTGEVKVPEGLPARTSTTPVRTTEGQRKASAFYTQAEDANRIIETVIAGGKRAPTFGENVAGRLGFGVGNYLTSDDNRRMMAAAMRLADSWLRFTSGAAVPEPEVRRNAMAFLPQPGDDDQTLADKANARRLILESLKQAMGQAGDVDTDEQARTADQFDADNPYARQRPPL